jgi:serine/threonine kinase 38
MDKVRSWFSKFTSKDKSKPLKKKETAGSGKEVSKAPMGEEALSNVTKQKVAAAKQYIEDHYKKQMKNLQERKERYGFTASFCNYELMVLETF